jgi:hypothetical protein
MYDMFPGPDAKTTPLNVSVTGPWQRLADDCVTSAFREPIVGTPGRAAAGAAGAVTPALADGAGAHRAAQALNAGMSQLKPSGKRLVVEHDAWRQLAWHGVSASVCWVNP